MVCVTWKTLAKWNVHVQARKTKIFFKSYRRGRVQAKFGFPYYLFVMLDIFKRGGG